MQCILYTSIALFKSHLTLHNCKMLRNGVSFDHSTALFANTEHVFVNLLSDNNTNKNK